MRVSTCSEKLDIPISSKDFSWALGSLCEINRIPFDPLLLLKQHPPPYNLGLLLQAARALGLKTGQRMVSASRLQRLALPCLAILHSPAAAAPESDPNAQTSYSPALVLKTDGERVLFFEARSQTSTVLPLSRFAARFSGQVVLFSAPAKMAANDAAQECRESPFGFRWFIAELLKYRGIWRDVLLASLAIQLMALATPLCTQVVIDKVVVHHTSSTLLVIGIALTIFMVFTAVMNWIRQYLILHTGNRVDAVLSLGVFEHLFRLPIRYFEHRPTGVIAARFQAIETIREFLSGAAITLILDLPFLLIFLGIMLGYSLKLSLITLAVLGLIMAISLLVCPLLRQRLNRQFMLGARNQAFLTEYVTGMETVKSLQMEPQLKARFSDYLAAYLEAGFKTRQLANTRALKV